MTRTLPYGSWPSPIDAASASAAGIRLDGARFVGDDVWWGEGLAAEGGRGTVRRRAASGDIVDVLPAPWSARSRVHEYGGGSWTATDDGTLLFVERSDQRVWLLPAGAAEPLPLTPADSGMRFGGLTWQHGLLLAVRESHREDAPPVRDIVEIGLDGTLRSLVGGSDFVAHPALSPDGRRLAWIAWNHPDMAWDRAELRVGRIESEGITEWTTLAGAASSAVQPEWVASDDLVYSDDPEGRWNLWRQHPLDAAPAAVAPADADTGGPVWVLGTRWYTVLDDGRIVAVRTNGSDEIALIAGDIETRLNIPATAYVQVEDSRDDTVLISGSSATVPVGLWVVNVSTGATTAVHGSDAPWDAEWMPTPTSLTADGPHGPVHAFAYPPTNPDVNAPTDEKPPYVVFVHGGPTAHVAGAAAAKIAYLTSRGIGVLDVNYGGSSGYGRAYRDRLRGSWGVSDVDDVVAAVDGLIETGAADPSRIAIAGGSAGGWTVLCALTRTDRFAAGISRYGVADLRSLAEDTHDYESRYLDGLVGPLPEAAELYAERSPLSRLDAFRAPLLIEQGTDDEVVPPSQSEAVRNALAARGIPHAYLLYEGEAHGFRRKETIVDALEKELAFLGAVFGFAPPGIPPLPLA